jgi:hypothetical protein
MMARITYPNTTSFGQGNPGHIYVPSMADFPDCDCRHCLSARQEAQLIIAGERHTIEQWAAEHLSPVLGANPPSA